MRVLILMHDAEEDAGTILDYLEKHGAKTRIVKLYGGEPFPENALQYDAVVSMGGPMNVYEEVAYPFLAKETDFLTRCFGRNIPVLGICLGAQMMAKAAGARVTKAPQEETGWYRVSLTDEGKADPFFSGLPESFTVFQLHGDTFGIPQEGTLLATSSTCPNQAFRIKNSLALQFHLEINDDKLAVWLADYNLRQEVLKTYQKVQKALDQNARMLYRNFFRL